MLKRRRVVWRDDSVYDEGQKGEWVKFRAISENEENSRNRPERNVVRA